jgi:hypothetical protein
MTKVYVLTNEPRGYDDDRYVINVFSSHQKAVDWATKHYPKFKHCSKASYGELNYDIEELVLDAD